MGMFDYVLYEAPCAGCGRIVMEWQSKDKQCALDVLNPSEVKDFYGLCSSCDTFNRRQVCENGDVINTTMPRDIKKRKKP